MDIKILIFNPFRNNINKANRLRALQTLCLKTSNNNKKLLGHKYETDVTRVNITQQGMFEEHLGKKGSTFQ